MTSDNELVYHILEPLVPLPSSVGVVALLSWLSGHGEGSGRRLSSAAQILEH